MDENKITILIFDDSRENISLIKKYFSKFSFVEFVPYDIFYKNKLNILNDLKILFVSIKNLESYHLMILDLCLKDRNLKTVIYSCSEEDLYVNISGKTAWSNVFFSTLQNLRQTVLPIIKEENDKKNKDKSVLISSDEFVAFQTYIGLRYLNKDKVVYFEYDKDDDSRLRTWKVYLNNFEIIKLKTNTTSKDILECFENHNFVQINQSTILNINYLSSIELKSRKCVLETPYNNKEMTISRLCLNVIKSKYEII